MNLQQETNFCWSHNTKEQKHNVITVIQGDYSDTVDACYLHS